MVKTTRKPFIFALRIRGWYAAALASLLLQLPSSTSDRTFEGMELRKANCIAAYCAAAKIATREDRSQTVGDFE